MAENLQKADAVEQYLKALRTDKVRKDYQMLLNNLQTFTEKEWWEIDRIDAQQYADFIGRKKGDKQLAQSTINVRIARLRAFYNFILKYRTDWNMTENPFAGVYTEQTNQKIILAHTPDREQMEEITRAAQEDSQLYMAVSMIKRCAFTVGELCSIQTNAIICDVNGNYGVKLSYKGIERWIKLPKDIVTIIGQTLKERATISQYLFCNKKGNRMRIRDMERLYRKYIPPECIFTLQDIRNGAITYMLKSGAPDNMVANYIGITYPWMSRYSIAIQELDLAPVDYVTPELYRAKETEQRLREENEALKQENERLRKALTESNYS